MHFLPWWALVACLAASAFAAYLLIGRTQAGDSRWALFALTAAAAPAVLAAAMAAAVVLSTLLSAYLWDQPAGRPEPSLAIALGFLLFALPGAEPGPYWVSFLPAMVVQGFGMALHITPLTTATLRSVERGRSGLASG